LKDLFLAGELTENLPKPMVLVGNQPWLIEKPKKVDAPSNRINTGIYIMERSAGMKERDRQLWLGNNVRVGLRADAQRNDCIFRSGMQVGPPILHEAVCNRNLEVQRR
jgi:hypothetical protein